tara:strand:- start:608 stop:775 length:168 start_codon:yes stop_codon:yes gene_type:complete
VVAVAVDQMSLVVELELEELEVIENLRDQHQVVIRFHQEVQPQLQRLLLQLKVIQ